MPSSLPDPLVPAEVDLTDFKFMPLDVARLLQSDWWMTEAAEDTRRAYAAMNLWARAWHQRPAASLPDNDRALARLAMLDLGDWLEIKASVMTPWKLCSDGRWYHPVVAEKAIEAWDHKEKYAGRASSFSAQQSARARSKWKDPSAEAAAKKRSERLAEARRKGTHTKAEWIALLEFCGGRCVKCGSDVAIVKDHILPIYRGGSDAIENIQPFCTSCNSSKGPDDTDYRPKNWRDALKRLPNACRTPAENACRTPPNEIDSDRDSDIDSDNIKSANALSSDAAAPEPREIPKGEGYTAEFEAWWRVYPRREGKGAAFRAYKAAKRLVTPDRLTSAAQSYAERVKGTEVRYIKQPATWLNQHCWNDERDETKKGRGSWYVPMHGGFA